VRCVLWCVATQVYSGSRGGTPAPALRACRRSWPRRYTRRARPSHRDVFCAHCRAILVVRSGHAQTIDGAHVITLVMDAQQPLTKQDMALAQHAVDEGKAVVVVLNKMDVAANRKLLLDAVKQRLLSAVWQAGGVECVPVSALKQQYLDDIFPAV
jgi:hypothetical protein